MSNIALQVNNVTMKYRLATEQIDSFKHFLIKKMKREVKYEEFYALEDVSFCVERGETLGIIGMNGAGKSTLLKIVAGINKPTSGEVIRSGSIAPLLELGAGFNSELNGIENIYLNGLLLGYSKKFINEKIEEIIEFSDLGKFIYSPIKNYSSGMKARLGFAIATLVQPDILIVDEVLSVGDIKFREKASNKVQAMMNGGTTVLFVSHSLNQVESLCKNVLWLENGTVKEIGPSKKIIEQYIRYNKTSS